MKKFTGQKKRNRRFYLTVISSVALSCGGGAVAQTNGVATTNSVASDNSANVANLGNLTVVGQLDQARSQIMPNLGATAYTQTKEQIESASQGGNAPFSQVILRAPGVVQDNAASGNLHVRGEHANLQYRINDVLLPEGVGGFGLELDPRFVDSIQLITGSLPAQYGFRTAGVIDIQTRSGEFVNGGEAEIYGGSYDTIRPGFEYGGSSGKLNYFIDGSYDHNALGIENPTSSHDAIHDVTDQGKAFAYLSYVLDDSSRINFIASASYSNFQIPNTPGLQNDPASHSAPGGDPWLPGTFDSSTLNENQNEQNYYGVVSYQKTAGKLNYQIAAFGRESSLHFMPDPAGDLFFNGVAGDVDRKLTSGGLQGDASFEINDKHTLRGGVMLLEEFVTADSTTTVFPMDSTDPGTFNPSGAPFSIADNHNLTGSFYGLYLQDEWKILESLTANFGARFDVFNSSFDNENQISPRINFIWQPTGSTTLHWGYARYFTPPPLEDVSGSSVDKFDGTSNESPAGPNAPDDHVKAERADYFDAGISQKIGKHLQVGLDSYYKWAKNQLDDGLFGQALILSAFNYERGEIYGAEFTASYNQGGFSAYANVAYSVAKGENWNSSQFLFDPSDAAFVKNHWIFLDHDQTVTGSFGVSYLWNESHRASTRVYVDALYGSGLRTDAPGVPNGATVPAYYSVNLGAEQSFKVHKNQILKARLDVVNVTDNSYVLRDGGGVGVNAASFGERIGFFGSISYVF
jgi:hypothetical protein